MIVEGVVALCMFVSGELKNTEYNLLCLTV